MAGKVNGNGKIQVSMWMDQELAERVERAAEELNNSLSGMSGYLIKLGLEAYEARMRAQEGRTA